MEFELGPSKPPTEDDYFMGIALAVRRKANCTGNRVAAVIVKDKRVIATGYNGTPEGMANCLDGGCLRCQNPNGQFPSGTGYDLCICVHAEQNALLSAARFGISVEGADLYTTMQPCFGCAKEIAQAKIDRVIYLHPWIPTNADPKLDISMKSEYKKILARTKIKHLDDFADPVEPWAVTTKRHHQHEVGK
ncbi:MAG TPA: dCMP deaminase family protein [Rhodanobacteraceae bacterium]